VSLNVLSRLYRYLTGWVYRLLRLIWRYRNPVTLGVRVLLYDGEQVLLVRHSYMPEWYLPGGRPGPGESLSETARREAREEVAADIGSVKLLGVLTHQASHRSDHVVVFYGEWEGIDGGGPVANSAEIEAIRMPSVLALPDQVSSEAKMAIRKWQAEAHGDYSLVP
jgi:8-oxo-dGTP pyrophosphatase MutT (NUDIX family)